MNPRTTTLTIGVVSVLFGVVGLLYPGFVMAHVLGFTVAPNFPTNFVHGEVRAVYGGLFTVLGVATTLAGLDPAANRSRILFLGLCWLGLLGGRMFGAVVDGSPGLVGWGAAAFEAVVGGLLVAASQMASDSTVADEPRTPEL